MNIGQRIKQCREHLGLSQEELAQKLGYKSLSTINKIESGINDITQSKVVEFARVLQTTPAVLMGWEEPENSSPIQLDEAEQLQSKVNEIASRLSLDNLEIAAAQLEILLKSQENGNK